MNEEFETQEGDGESTSVEFTDATPYELRRTQAITSPYEESRGWFKSSDYGDGRKATEVEAPTEDSPE